MDKHKVKAILAPYSPPLSQSQVDAIADEIVAAVNKSITDLKAGYKVELENLTDELEKVKAEQKEETETPTESESSPAKKVSKQKS